MGKDLRHFGHLGKDDRLTQGLPHRVVGQREAGAERQNYHPGENRPPAHGVVHTAHVDHHVSRCSA